MRSQRLASSRSSGNWMTLLFPRVRPLQSPLFAMCLSCSQRLCRTCPIGHRTDKCYGPSGSTAATPFVDTCWDQRAPSQYRS